MKPRRVRSVLFVCTGNICRSPLAQGLMEQALLERAPGSDVRVDSAGTHAHVGEMPHPLSVTVAAVDYGIDITAQRGRQLTHADFHEFDWLIALDRGHRDYMEARLPADARGTVRLLLQDALPGSPDVPDPYGRRRSAYEDSARLIKIGVDRLLGELLLPG
jgi:protein-tyrosine phosphatase